MTGAKSGAESGAESGTKSDAKGGALARNLKRTGLSLLIILLLIVALTGGIATWLLGTTHGGRWLLDQVPGLSVNGFDGQLARQWQADTLQWQSDTLTVNLEDLAMGWSPGCLWDRQVCIDSLRVATLALTTSPDETTPADEPDDGPIALPEIKLPLRVSIDQLSLGRFMLNDSLILQDLGSSISVAGTDLSIDNLSLARDEMELDLSGTLSMSGDWPLDSRLEFRMPLMDEPFEVLLNANGRLARNVNLAAETRGYVDASLNGLVQPLEPGVPAELTVKPSKLPIPEAVPPTVRPENVEIVAIGNLNEGWSVEARAQLPAAEAPMPLTISAHVTTAGARIKEIMLNQGGDGTLRLAGELQWAEALAARAELSWRDFPWQQLMPDMAPLPVNLQTLDANVRYANEAYEGQLAAEFTGPAGPSRLATPFQGDLGQIRLPELTLEAGPGGINGNVAVQFAEALGWDADLRIEDLDPGFWVEALPGLLSGTVQSQGELTEAGPELTARVDLKGRLREQEAEIQVDARASGEQWQAKPLLVRLGDNRISGQASQADTLAASLDLDLPQLAQLWPGLAGNLSGQVQASGWPGSLRASAIVQGDGLSYDDLTLESIALDANLAGETLSLEVRAQGIEAAEQRLEQVRLDADGTLAQHQLRVRAEETRGSVDLTFNGGSETISSPLADPAATLPAAGDGGNSGDSAAVWAGTLSAGDIRVADQHWQLQSPADLAYRENGVATLGAHCWNWQDASLCSEDQRLWPDPRIRVALSNLPSTLVAPLLPAEVQWLSSINAQIALDMDEAGPRGEVTLAAEPGQFQILSLIEGAAEADEAEPEWIEYPYDTLSLTADLTPARVIAEARFSGPSLGRFDAQLTIEDPNGEIRPLRGSFSLDGLELAVARPFAQLEELAGRISGNGQIDGTLMDPRVNGQLQLNNGQLADRRLPLQFEELNLQIDFSETGAELAGGWRSGDQGRGNLAGNANWGEALNADIRITGERLPAVLEPFAKVEIEPDINVIYRQGQLRIAGDLNVPRGAVEIRELPPQAVQVSEDEIIVGSETETPIPESDEEEDAAVSPVENLSMNLTISVGEDELTFDGFGVTGNLEGTLRIGDNLDTRGELSLVEGQYEIYGQQLQLRKANLLFAGPISQPFLEIEAIRQVDDVTAGIRLTGSAENPRTEVFSEPAMSEEQALSYLILGRPLQSEQDSNVVGTAALSIGLNQAAPLTRALGERLGVQDLQLDTEGGGDSQSIVASGYITEKLSVRYGVGLFDSISKLALRYDLSERLYLEAASGIASSLDIFYSRDY